MLRMSEIRGKLGSMCTPRSVILGVGNRLRGDDGAGSVLIDRIGPHAGMHGIDGGMAPENYAEKIVRLLPDTVLIVDAVDFGGGPGEIRITSPQEFAWRGLASHAPSLSMLCEYLSRRLKKVNIIVLGIQPKRVALDDPMSDEVALAVEELSSVLLEVGGGTGHGL